MNQDTALAVLLGRVSADALREFSLGEPPDLEGLVRAERKRPIAASTVSQDFRAKLANAIRAFRIASDTPDFRTLRLLCFAAFQRLEDGYAIVGDTERLAVLLDRVNEHIQDPPRLRRLCDVLLKAYLDADRYEAWFADPRVRDGCERVRVCMGRVFVVIKDLEPMPGWVEALRDYPEVIAASPGQRFAKDWLVGGGKEFRDAADRLGLPGSSWLVLDTLREAVSLACRQPSAQFGATISALVDAAGEPKFRAVRDEVYASLVNHYASLADRAVNPMLRDALVRAWGNPWLASNEASWTLASPAARQLVTSWLKLALIHQFFDVLSDRAWQDTGRFEFWRAYHERMDEVYFALSRAAFRSSSPDIERFKADAAGLIFELTGSTSQNHAFIMRIGNVAVVEFSEKGNAAYLYAHNDLEVDVRRREVSIHELKNRAAGTQLRHAAARGFTWEERFSSALGRTPRSTRVEVPDQLPHHLHQVAPTLERITAYARDASIAIEDHRARGGSFWLKVDDADPDISRQLGDWGLKYRPGRGWWRAA